MLDVDDPMLKIAEDVFTSRGVEFELKLGAAMMWVKGKDRWYAFYPTTGRWCPYGMRGKHYRSKGPEDFLDRFAMKGSEAREAIESLKPQEFNKVSMKDVIFWVYERFEEGKSEWDVLREMNYCAGNKAREDRV
jgi:hypothetical protein